MSRRSPGRLVCAVMLAACQAGSSRNRPDSPVENPSAASPAIERASDSSASPWQLATGRSAPVTPETSEAQLQQRYGSSALGSIRVELGEGETAPGTVLYPSD